MLRTIISNVRPCPSAVPPADFYASKIQQVKVPLYNSEGKLVREVTESRIVKEKLPNSYFYDPSLTKDMFSLEALQAAGVPIAPINMPQIGSDLNTVGIVTDYIEGVDYEQLIEKEQVKTKE